MGFDLLSLLESGFADPDLIDEEEYLDMTDVHVFINHFLGDKLEALEEHFALFNSKRPEEFSVFSEEKIDDINKKLKVFADHYNAYVSAVNAVYDDYDDLVYNLDNIQNTKKRLKRRRKIFYELQEIFQEFSVNIDLLENEILKFSNELLDEAKQQVAAEANLALNKWNRKEYKKKKKKNKKIVDVEFKPLTDVALGDADKQYTSVKIPLFVYWKLENFYFMPTLILRSWNGHMKNKIIFKIAASRCRLWKKSKTEGGIKPELVPLTIKKYEQKTTVKRRVLCVYSNRERLKLEGNKFQSITCSLIFMSFYFYFCLAIIIVYSLSSFVLFPRDP